MEAQAHTTVWYRCDARKATGQIRVLLAWRVLFHAAELVFLIFKIVVAVTTDFAFAVGARFVDPSMSAENGKVSQAMEGRKGKLGIGGTRDGV